MAAWATWVRFYATESRLSASRHSNTSQQNTLQHQTREQSQGITGILQENYSVTLNKLISLTW